MCFFEKQQWVLFTKIFTYMWMWGEGGWGEGYTNCSNEAKQFLWNLNFVDLLLNIERHRTCCVAKQYFNGLAFIFYFLFVLCCITFLDLVGKICWPYFKHAQFWSNFVIYIFKVKLKWVIYHENEIIIKL
jgi:hypothetical protein